MTRRPGRGDRDGRAGRGDDGGVWIATGWALGVLVYAWCVVMVIAGFTAVLPLVVVPPVIVLLIVGSHVVGGPRNYGGRGGGATGEPGPGR